MKDSPQPVKRHHYDAAFRAEALYLAGESHSTQAAIRALHSSPKLRYKWQKKALIPVAAARGVEPAPATAAELRPLRALARRQARGLAILKKAIASKRFSRVISVADTLRAVTALSKRNGRLIQCARFATCWAYRPAATTSGNRRNNKL